MIAFRKTNKGGKYKVSECINGKWIQTIAYRKWVEMIRRCNDPQIHIKQPELANNTVCDEWYEFQNFAEWFYNNCCCDSEYYPELDKDILQKGNKIYGPDYCSIVPRKINRLMSGGIKAKRNPYIGVVSRTRGNYVNYQAQISKHGKNIKLGSSNNPEIAFNKYKIAKQTYIKELATEHKFQMTEICYNALINYKVEITD